MFEEKIAQVRLLLILFVQTSTSDVKHDVELLDANITLQFIKLVLRLFSIPKSEQRLKGKFAGKDWYEFDEFEALQLVILNTNFFETSLLKTNI